MENSDLPPFANEPPRAIISRPAPLRMQEADPSCRGSAGAQGLMDIWRVLWRRKLLIWGMAVSCALAGCLLSLTQTPMYQARTSLEIQAVNENFLQMKDVDPNTADGYSAEALMETQVKLLQEEA